MVINQGLTFLEPQTIFYLGDVQLIDSMAAKVRIAPRGWLQPCGNDRCGDIIQHYPKLGCRGETITQRFPIDFDATLAFEEKAVVLDTPNTQSWPDGLYEAQIIILYHGSEMPVKELVLFELGQA